MWEQEAETDDDNERDLWRPGVIGSLGQVHLVRQKIRGLNLPIHKNGLNSFEFIWLTFFNKNVNEGHEQALDRLNWIKFEFVLLFCNRSDVTVHLEMKFNRSFKLIERKPYETRLITIFGNLF